MKGGKGCPGFCCCCFDCASFASRGKRRGLPEEDAASEKDMDPKGDAEDGEEKDVPRMEGYLEKKGKSRLVSTWRRYWFVLEGRRLTYYEGQPRPSTELPPSCKGSLSITPATSITVSKQTSSNSTCHQPNYKDIYILNPSRLITLRTKEADQHASWVTALVASTNLPIQSPTSNGSKSPKSTDTTRVFPLRPCTKYFRYSLTNLSNEDGKKAHWPKKLSNTMDSRSSSLYQRKSGSMDDIIDKYTDGAKETDIISDSDEDDNEDLKSKTVSPVLVHDMTLQNPLEYSLPMIQHELPPARLCDYKERKELIKRTDCIEGPVTIGDWDKKHESSNSDHNYEAENDLSTYMEIKATQSTRQPEASEGKMRTRRFFSLVSKDSRLFEGIYKTEKAPKKDRESVMAEKHRGSVQMVPHEKEKHKVKHKQIPSHHDEKDDNHDKDKSKKVNSTNENDQSGPSCRISLIKRTHEFRSARKIKRNRERKKGGNDDSETRGVSNENPAFHRQTSLKDKSLIGATPLEDADPKKKRSKISFLTKMLRSKKADGQEDLSDKLDILEDETINSPSAPDKPALLHSSEVDGEDSLPQVNAQPPHITFGLKLFPVVDAELKRKLESRMALIESEIANSTENGQLPGPTLPRAHDVDSTSSTAGSAQMHTNMKNEEGPLTSPPPALPPRLIKLTPPTPPISDAYQSDTPNPLLGIYDSTVPENFTFSGHSSESDRGSKHAEEIILCSTTETELECLTQSKNDFGGVRDSMTLSETLLPLILNSSNAKGRYQTDLGHGVNKNGIHMRDSGANIDFYTSYSDEKDFSMRKSWDTSKNMGESERLSGDSVSCLPHFTNTSQGSGSHIDELSLLLNELDRINSSPLQQEVARSNHRPVSDEIKKVSTFEEDYINAFPIRRRRNSDPDYDIPRPHRIPHLQETKEENQGDAQPSKSQQSERKSYGRENTDSIVIEATRFFGPGMDFSFDEKKYSDLKNIEDFWDHLCGDESQDLTSDDSSFFYASKTEGTVELKSDGELLPNKTVTLEEELPESNTSQIKIKEDTVDFNEQSPVEESEENCVLRSKNKLQIDGGGEENIIVLRSSSIDRVCRKERSREIYEEDLNDQFKMNDLLEGLSISSTLHKDESPNVEKDEGISSQVQTDLSYSTDEKNEEKERVTQDSVDHDVSAILSQGYCTVDVLEVPEQIQENITTSQDSTSNITVGIKTPPESTTSNLEAWDGNEDRSDAQENEVVLRSKSDNSSTEDNKNFRLSFATTETLLVEEEVLVATLKTTTTTTTLLPFEGDGTGAGSNRVQKVEEFVEETVLDLDQLSDDHFGPMKIQSCVQT